MTANIHAYYAPPGSPQLPRIARAEGVYLWDASGKRYLDAACGPVVTNIGHGNAAVIQAMKNQLDSVAFACRTSFESDANLAFSTRLAALCGPGLDVAFPTSGGSEAIEACMKFARQRAVIAGEPERWKILSRNPSYHGATLGALSLTGDPESNTVFAPLLADMPKFPAPFSYRIPDGLSAEDYAQNTLDVLEETIEREGPGTCLAVIIEPVGGLATGALVAPEAYYTRLRAICDRYGLLLIFDEIMSGAGRTGRFLAADHWPGARPDLVALAKGLSAGYAPLGVMVAPRDMVEEIARARGFLHGHTYVANPLSSAAGAAVLAETDRLDLIANAATMGTKLDAALQRIAGQSPIVGDVRGLGLLRAVELVPDKANKDFFPLEVDITQRVKIAARNRGLIVYARRTARGAFGEWIMIAPPLTIDDAVLGELETLLSATLDDVVADLHREGLLPSGIS